MSRRSKQKRLESRQKAEKRYLDNLARIRAKAAIGTTQPLTMTRRERRAAERSRMPASNPLPSTLPDCPFEPNGRLYDDPEAISRLGRETVPTWDRDTALRHVLTKGRYAGLTLGQIAQTESGRNYLLWMRNQEWMLRTKDMMVELIDMVLGIDESMAESDKPIKPEMMMTREIQSFLGSLDRQLTLALVGD